MRRTLLFHRAFAGYTGGHGKVFDYYRHTQALPGWMPSIYFSAGLDHVDNPWRLADVAALPDWRPSDASALFLAGVDWLAYPEDCEGRPVVNLIQHVRHAEPGQDVYPFLSRPAVRICVSQSVADAILASGRVRGPVRVIDAALDLPVIDSSALPQADIAIAAIKNPELGRILANRWAKPGSRVTLLDRPLSRQRYLEAISAATTVVCLPNRTEGFYLPALEAMALGCAVVVPDCVGNRAYLSPGRNAEVPDWTIEAFDASLKKLEDEVYREKLCRSGLETAHRFTQQHERDAFSRVLADLSDLWKEAW